jgi:hypothetical protein
MKTTYAKIQSKIRSVFGFNAKPGDPSGLFRPNPIAQKVPVQPQIQNATRSGIKDKKADFYMAIKTSRSNNGGNYENK